MSQVLPIKIEIQDRLFFWDSKEKKYILAHICDVSRKPPDVVRLYTEDSIISLTKVDGEPNYKEFHSDRGSISCMPIGNVQTLRTKLWNRYYMKGRSRILVGKYRGESQGRIVDGIAWKIYKGEKEEYSIRLYIDVAWAIFNQWKHKKDQEDRLEERRKRVKELMKKKLPDITRFPMMDFIHEYGHRVPEEELPTFSWFSNTGRFASKHSHPHPKPRTVMSIDPARPTMLIIDDMEGDKEKTMGVDYTKLTDYPDTGRFGQVYMINRYINWKGIQRRIVIAGQVREYSHYRFPDIPTYPVLNLAFSMCRPLDDNGDEFDLELGQRIATKRLNKRPLAEIKVGEFSSMSRRMIRAVMEDYADDMEENLDKYVAFASEVANE